MGLFVYYFGTKKIYNDVEHHTIKFGNKYKEHLDDIFDKKKLNNDISYYLHRPSATDTLIEIATGNFITGSLVNQINFAQDGNLYTKQNGSEIAYKVHYESVSNFPGTITDISVDPNNPDNVCVVTSGTSTNHVYYSTNATSSNPSFNSIDGDLPDMPVFGCIVELSLIHI